MAIFQRYYSRKLAGYMSWGMAKWKEITAEVRLERSRKAALAIQRSTRGYFGRVLVGRMRLERLRQQRKQQAIIQRRLDKVHSSAVRIQKVWKGYFKGRKVVAEVRRQVKAAKVIQRSRRTLLAKRAAWSVLSQPSSYHFIYPSIYTLLKP